MIALIIGAVIGAVFGLGYIYRPSTATHRREVAECIARIDAERAGREADQ